MPKFFIKKNKADSDPLNSSAFSRGNRYTARMLSIVRFKWFFSAGKSFKLIARVMVKGDVIPQQTIPYNQIFYTFQSASTARKVSVFYAVKDNNDVSGKSDSYKEAVPLMFALLIYKNTCVTNPEIESDQLSFALHTTKREREHWLTLHIEIDRSKKMGEAGYVSKAFYIDSASSFHPHAITYPTDDICQALWLLDRSISLTKIFTGHQALDNHWDCGVYARMYSLNLINGGKPKALSSIPIVSDEHRVDDAALYHEHSDKYNQKIISIPGDEDKIDLKHITQDTIDDTDDNLTKDSIEDTDDDLTEADMEDETQSSAEDFEQVQAEEQDTTRAEWVPIDERTDSMYLAKDKDIHITFNIAMLDIEIQEVKTFINQRINLIKNNLDDFQNYDSENNPNDIKSIALKYQKLYESLQRELLALTKDYHSTINHKQYIYTLLNELSEISETGKQILPKIKSYKYATDNANQQHELQLTLQQEIPAFLTSLAAFEEKYYIKRSLKTNAGIIACAIIGSILGTLILGVAGLVAGAVIGGGVGSIIPAFGTAVGAIATGSVAGFMGAMKGAGIGAGIGTAAGIYIFGGANVTSAYLSKNFWLEKNINKTLLEVTGTLRQQTAFTITKPKK